METRQVVLLTTFSFIVFTVGENAKTGKLPDGKQLIAWGLLFIILVAIADFPSTASLAAALAWLVMLSVFLINGYDFFTKLTETVR